MNPLSPLLKVVRCSPNGYDPSLDEDAMASTPEGAKQTLVTQYITTRDESLLRFVEGSTPTWFHIRRLPISWLAEALDPIPTRSVQRILAFRAACHTIEIPGDPLSVSAPKEPGPFVARAASYGVTVAPESWAQEIGDRFGAEVVQEMGEVAITHSRLARGARGPFSWWGGSVASP